MRFISFASNIGPATTVPVGPAPAPLHCYYCRAAAVTTEIFFSVVMTSLQCHFRNKTTEIQLKECSAYGQIDQGGGSEREETYIYEHPQY